MVWPRHSSTSFIGGIAPSSVYGAVRAYGTAFADESRTVTLDGLSAERSAGKGRPSS